MHHVVIQYAVPKKIPGVVLLKRWANATLAPEFLPKKFRGKAFELTIRIVEPEEMIALNTTYRKKQGPTNVLAFPFEPLPSTSRGLSAGSRGRGLDPADKPRDVGLRDITLGDIVICADVVHREAKEQHKKSKDHFAHMVVHGTLHLLGYDHVEEKDAVKMEAQEVRILNSLNIQNPYQLSEKGI